MPKPKILKKAKKANHSTATKKIISSKKKIVPKKVTAKKAVKKAKPALKQKLAKKGVRLKKALHNPIIKPRAYPWESKATFNPAAFVAHGKVHIIYRAIGDNDASVLGYASSYDGYHILERPTYFVYNKASGIYKHGEKIDYISGGGWSGGCEDPRLTLIDDTVYMIYTAFDGWGSLRLALTSIPLADFEKRKWNWQKSVLISPPGEIHKNWVIFPGKINGKYAILHSISPEIMVDYFDSLDELDGTKFIHSIHQNDPRWQLRERGIRGVGPAPIKTRLGWLVLYHKTEDSDPGKYKLFAMILDSNDPKRVLYRSPSPILEPEEHYENHGWTYGVVYSCGAVVKGKDLIVYYGGADKVVCVASMPLEELLEDLEKNKTARLKKNTIFEFP